MKSIKLFIASLLILLGMVTVSCKDDFDTPPVFIPVATMQANTTIQELKSEFWQNSASYVTEIGKKADGSDIIIKGRVISSDESGNIYKQLYIQDATGAICISINQGSLYTDYRVGQEIVINVSDLYIGRYSGMIQIGIPNPDNVNECGRMSLALFQANAEPNGLPEVAKLDTIVLDLGKLPSTTDKDSLMKYQGQLVVVKNASFVEAGQPYCAPDASQETGYANTSRNLTTSGGSIIVRNSAYSTFKSEIIPEGEGSVTGILSYYSGWQLLLNSTADLVGFGEVAEGAKGNPYTVARAIELQNQNIEGWIAGYIVGAVAPGVQSVSGNGDIEWTAPTVLANTIVVGPTADTKDITKCVIVGLPDGSALRNVANLHDNPDALGKEIKIKGLLKSYMGGAGVTTSGTNENYVFAGSPVPDGDGTLNSPYNVRQALDLIASGTYPSTDVYLKGIISKIDGIDLSYGNATYYISDDGSMGNQLEIYRGKSLNGNKFTSQDEIKVGDVVVIKGQLTLFGSTPEVTTGSSIISINGQGGGDNPNPPTPGGAGSEENPFTVAQVIDGTATGTAWVEGYIVGWIDGMTYDSGLKFSAEGASQTNLVIGPTASTTDGALCIPVQLPSGAVRTALNLAANPTNLGKKVALYGSIENYFGKKGLKSATQYKLEGGSTPGEVTIDPVTTMNADFKTLALPTGWKSVTVSGDKSWYFASYPTSAPTEWYAAMTGYKGTTPPFDAWLVTCPLNVKDATNKTLKFQTKVNGYGSTTSVFEVYVLNNADPKVATVKTKLNPTLAVAPASGYSEWVNSGAVDLSSYGDVVYIGFRFYATVDANYATWNLSNVTFGL